MYININFVYNLTGNLTMMQCYVHNILKIHQRVNIWIWRAVQWHYVIVITTLQKLTAIFDPISLKFEINERVNTTAKLSSLSLNECIERVGECRLLAATNMMIIEQNGHIY